MAITVSAIVTAMENFSVLYRGTKFKNYTAKSGYKSGGFCAAFEIGGQGEAYIYRVPHAQMPNDRYREQVIDYISHLDSPYFEEFGIENKSLLVEDQLLDVTYMKKIEGQTFGEYIAQNKNNARALRTLAEKFLTMVTWLHQAQISHGDLNESNIMVRTNGDIVLIDYDTLCFRAIEGEHTELSNGKPAFQHPSRIKQASKLTLKADYFSELIIYLSLVALAEDNSLFRYVSTGDTLLFKSADFTDLHNSDIYRELHKLSDKIKELLDILVDYCAEKNYTNLNPFSEQLTKKNHDNLLDKLSVLERKLQKMTTEIGKSKKIKSELNIRLKQNKSNWKQCNGSVQIDEISLNIQQLNQSITEVDAANLSIKNDIDTLNHSLITNNSVYNRLKISKDELIKKNNDSQTQLNKLDMQLENLCRSYENNLYNWRNGGERDYLSTIKLLSEKQTKLINLEKNQNIILLKSKIMSLKANINIRNDLSFIVVFFLNLFLVLFIAV